MNKLIRHWAESAALTTEQRYCLSVQQLNQIADELEARTLTVKLPDCDIGAVQHMSGGSDDYCKGFVDGTQNAIKAVTKDCAAAGIQLKVEE